jgi:hypothetical protein
VSGAARYAIENVIVDWSRGCTELIDIAHQGGIVKHRRQAISGDPHGKNIGIAIHLRRNRRIECAMNPQFAREGLHFSVVLDIFLHQDVGNRHPQALRLQPPDRLQSSQPGSPNLRNGIMNARAVRIHADLNLFDSEFAKLCGLLLADQQPIGFQFYVEGQLSRVS